MRLVKIIDNELFIAIYRVAGPGYIIYTSSAANAQGWTYYTEEVDYDSFALPWKAPTGASDAYPLGSIVSHNSVMWRSLITANVWEPGVSGWRNISDDIPAWIQPTGAHDAYQKDAVVAHSSKMWRSLLDANVWEPGVSGWREAVLMPPSGVAPPSEWVQPTGEHDAYALGARVTYQGQIWVSTVSANVWAPGVYGWVLE